MVFVKYKTETDQTVLRLLVVVPQDPQITDETESGVENIYFDSAESPDRRVVYRYIPVCDVFCSNRAFGMRLDTETP